jgi:hypothetical protein
VSPSAGEILVRRPPLAATPQGAINTPELETFVLKQNIQSNGIETTNTDTFMAFNMTLRDKTVFQCTILRI